MKKFLLLLGTLIATSHCAASNPGDSDKLSSTRAPIKDALISAGRKLAAGAVYGVIGANVLGVSSAALFPRDNEQTLPSKAAFLALTATGFAIVVEDLSILAKSEPSKPLKFLAKKTGELAVQAVGCYVVLNMAAGRKPSFFETAMALATGKATISLIERATSKGQAE